MIKRPIYLDYMSTTPVDERVLAQMLPYLHRDGEFGNAASNSHSYGWTAAAAVAEARDYVADLIHAEADEIIWTSGATEANNLALKGAARFYRRQGNHIVTCATEHKAVLDPCAQLAREGFVVTYVQPSSNGLINLADLEKTLRADTLLVSIMHVNNEIGVIQDIKAIGELTRARGILLHVDAAQSAGKIAIDVKNMFVDLMSFSAHKVYGPKGIGALYIRGKPRLRLEPLCHGGGQEHGLRPGTLPVHQIVGMGEAFRIAKQVWADENADILQLRQRLWTGLQQQLEEVYLNGDETQRVAGNLNVSFAGVDAQALMEGLPTLAVSSGSACISGDSEPSYVLRAIGLSESLARSAIRFSIGRFTTQAQIDCAIEAVVKTVRRLRGLFDPR
jgi:cysteine desulfurase